MRFHHERVRKALLQWSVWGLCILPCLAWGQQPQVAWVNSMEKGLSLAMKEMKPLMVSLHDPQEKWCFSMDFYTYADKRVAQEIMVNFIPVRIEKGGREVRLYEVRRYPSVLFLQPTGEEIDRCEQFVAADVLLDMMREAAKGETTFQHWKSVVASDPGNSEACFHLAEKYLSRYKSQEAIALYEKVIQSDPEEKNWFTPEAKLGVAFAWGQDGKHEKAITALSEFVDAHPASPLASKAAFSIGLTYFFDEKIQKAEDQLREVAGAYPDTPWGKKAEIMSEEMKQARERPPDGEDGAIHWESDFMGPENLLGQTQKPLSDSGDDEKGKKKKDKKKKK